MSDEENKPLLEAEEMAAAKAPPGKLRDPVLLASLDMLAELNEPEQLVLELQRIADEHPHEKRWTVVKRMCARAVETFAILHKAPETPIAKG